MEEFKRIINILLDFHIEQINKISFEKELPTVALERCQYTVDYLGLFHAQIVNAIEIHFEKKELTEFEQDIIKKAYAEFCFAGMPKIPYSELK